MSMKVEAIIIDGKKYVPKNGGQLSCSGCAFLDEYCGYSYSSNKPFCSLFSDDGEVAPLKLAEE